MKKGIINSIKNWRSFRSVNLRHGKNFNVFGRLYLHGRGPIVVGDNVTIISGTNYNPSAGEGSSHFKVWRNAKLVIGDGAGISNTTINAYEYVEIGKRVAIGSGCIIMDLDYHSLNLSDRANPGDMGKIAPVIIKDDVFIGAKSMILKGVTIGEGSVVGAGSVVTHSIPDGELWAGNPAVFVRKINQE